MFWQAIVAAHLSATKVIDTDAIFTILSERRDEPPGQQAVMNYLRNYRARTDKTVSFASKKWTLADFEALVKSLPLISGTGGSDTLHVVEWQLEAADLCITLCNKQLKKCLFMLKSALKTS